MQREMNRSKPCLKNLLRGLILVVLWSLSGIALSQVDDPYCEATQEAFQSGQDYRIWQGGTGGSSNNWHTSDNWTSECFGGCGLDPLPWFLSNVYVDDPTHLNRLRNTNSTICRLYVGEQSEGALEISQSGSLISKRAILGYRVGGDGQVTVSGSGVSWLVETQPEEALIFEGLFVGLEGSGELIIENGSEVTAPGVSLASGADSAGTLNLNDSGSRLDAGEVLALGLGGNADITTENGAVLDVDSVLMSFLDTADSTGLIQDPGSAWTISAGLVVGASGLADLQLDQSGEVTADEIVLAEQASAEASVLSVRDAYLLSQNDLLVAESGTATLEASLDGRARGHRVIAGVNSGSSGTIEVKTGGRVSSGADFIVGQQGDGTLDVLSGGTITVGGAALLSQLDLAEQAGSSGTLRLTGLLDDLPGQIQAGGIRAGSGTAAVVIDHDSTSTYELINSQDNAVVLSGSVNLRHLGTGTSRVFDSEYTGNTRVRSGRLELIGGQPGQPSSSVWVGVENADDAVLRISEGAVLSSSLAVIGQEAGSAGRVVIDGVGEQDGAALEHDGSVEIGRFGEGELAVHSDGRVSAISLALAAEPDSSGVLQIGNGAQPGQIDVGLIDGGNGLAELRFNHDASNWAFVNSGDLQPQLQGTLDVIHEGPGETVLTGLSLIDGDVTVEQGTLRLSTSLLSSTETLVVGSLPGLTAGLEVLAGTAAFDVIRIGRGATSVGHVLLNNPGGEATLSSTRFMIAGGTGEAMIDCQSGCRIDTGEGAVIGRFPAGLGEVLLTEDGQWLLGGDLTVAEQGIGLLQLDQEALLSVRPLSEPGTIDLALQAESSGDLVIGASGMAGQLDAASVVGGAGQATLNFRHAEALHEFVNLDGEPILLSGSLRLLHNGTGTTRLAGDHVHTGQTAINNGTLIIVDTVTADVSIGKAGRLESGGRIEADVTSFGRIAPGEDGPGRLVIVGDLTLDDLSTLEFQLGPPDQEQSLLNDRIQVDGGVVLAGELEVSALPDFDVGRYRLIEYTGALDDQGLQVTGLPPGVDPSQVSIDSSNSGKIDLVISGSVSPPDIIFQGGFSGP